MAEAAILTRIIGAVGVLTVNRPARLNALDLPLLTSLSEEFAAFEKDPLVRAIMITGGGDRSFVAGGDIADIGSRDGLAHYAEYAETVHAVFNRIEASDKPTIAAVNGYALGGGVELLLACDLRFAADSAQFGLPEITLGLFPGAGGSQRLIRQVPLCRAKELMFLGERIAAAEALAIGLINRVVAKEHVLDEALAIATKIAERSPMALRLLKRTIRHGLGMPLREALAYEQAMIGLVLDSEDAHEGCAAFIEKRRPEFKGR